MNRVQTYRKETAFKCRSLLPAADGEGNFGVQGTLHPAVELGRAGLAGGGEIGACHAAPQSPGYADAEEFQQLIDEEYTTFEDYLKGAGLI